MITFKQYIHEGLKKAERLYNAGLKQSNKEHEAKRTFHDIMGSSPEERIISDLNDRPDPSTELFNRGDKEVLKMMARAARKSENADITSQVKNIHTALRTGASNPTSNMASKMKKIRSSIDLIRAGDRGEYGTLIPEI